MGSLTLSKLRTGAHVSTQLRHRSIPSRLTPIFTSCHAWENRYEGHLFVSLNKGDEVVTLNMIKSAPVGPVAGGIMGCIMVLVLAVYAYRHQIHRRSHQHMSPLAAQGELQVDLKLLQEAPACFVSFHGWKDGSLSREPLST